MSFHHDRIAAILDSEADVEVDLGSISLHQAQSVQIALKIALHTILAESHRTDLEQVAAMLAYKIGRAELEAVLLP